MDPKIVDRKVEEVSKETTAMERELANCVGGAGVRSREDLIARRKQTARLKETSTNLKFEDLTVVTDGPITTIFCNRSSEEGQNGGMRSIQYNVPVSKIWFTVHPYGLPDECECNSEYRLPGDRASYCIGRR